MTQTDDYIKARTRAEVKYGFYVHMGVFVGVMVLLVIINLVTAPGYLWFIWPFLGWGIAVAIHAALVFLVSDRTTVLDKLTEREMRKASAQKAD